jgi:hypothetical protein
MWAILILAPSATTLAPRPVARAVRLYLGPSPPGLPLGALFCFAVLLVKKAHNVPGGLLVALLPEELGC